MCEKCIYWEGNVDGYGHCNNVIVQGEVMSADEIEFFKEFCCRHYKGDE